MTNRINSLLLLAGILLLLLSGPAQGAKKHTFVLQGGWPYVEMEVLSRLNAYGNLGLYWGDFLAETHWEHSHWLLPLEAAVGVQWRINEYLRFRSGLRFLFSIEHGRQRVIEESRNEYDVIVLLEAGLRLELEIGFVAGLQLPFFGIRESAVLPPDVLKRVYIYAGYGWFY
jgi:hypothetical protein